jgi:hypothetical protein
VNAYRSPLVMGVASVKTRSSLNLFQHLENRVFQIP